MKHDHLASVFSSVFQLWQRMQSPVVVITGGPCTGKSSTIEDLAAAGFSVATEEAEKLIKLGKPSLQDEYYEFQAEVVRRQMSAEVELARSNGGRLIFADRGVFDNVAYCVIKDGVAPGFLTRLPNPRYKLAFLMEPLGIWVNNGVRKENLAFTQQITPLLETAYRERGLEVIRVPSGTREWRLDFILESARSRGIVLDKVA